MKTSEIRVEGTTTTELIADFKIAMLEILTDFQNQKKDPNDNLLTREEVCELLNINFTTLWKHTKSGKLKKLKLGRRVFYKKDQVLAAVEEINLKKEVLLNLKDASSLLKLKETNLKTAVLKGYITATQKDNAIWFSKQDIESAKHYFNRKPIV